MLHRMLYVPPVMPVTMKPLMLVAMVSHLKSFKFFRASTNRILLMNLSRMWNKQVAISSFSLEQRNRSETVVAFLCAEDA